MPSIVLTLPILAGKVEAWRRFCQEMSGSRLTTYEASRWRLGITHERLALIDTPFGATVITRLEAHDVGQALGHIITSTSPFDIWYREQMQELHGVILAVQGFAPPSETSHPEQVVHFEWRRDSELSLNVN